MKQIKYTVLTLVVITLLNCVVEAEVVLLPSSVKLSGSVASQQLLVQKIVAHDKGKETGAQISDGVQWKSENPKIVEVSTSGLLTAKSNGETKIIVQVGNETATVTVKVAQIEKQSGLSFRHDVLPILSKAGCNSGACHGALAGKGGFRLSLRGYDHDADHFNIVKQDRGRRIEFADPGRSLILAKPSGGMPHKGGIRFETDSPEYQLLARWISTGAIGPQVTDPEVNSIRIFPKRSIQQRGKTQQMIVQAHFSDARLLDATKHVKWLSTNEAVCTVDEAGKVNIIGSGEGAIVAWYSSKIAIARITVPYPVIDPGKETANLVETRKPRGFIDEMIDHQLKRLNLPASGACSDQVFVRRVYIDTVGRLPEESEVRQFMTDTRKEKRDLLIDQLLGSDDFVDYWSYQFSDVLMINGTLLRPKAIKAYYEWLHGHLKKNTPWDKMVREIITATGNSYENGATNFYALNQTPEDMTENVCQAFLGLSIGCAKCHNHPLEKWTNDQYYGMANLFARVKAKGWGGETRNGDGLRTLYVSEVGDIVQPRTGKPQPPAPLDQKPLALEDPNDRRIALANWLTSPNNPYFARSIANRIWAKYFGVGLVEAVDDMRVSNPASNEELLQACADYLIKQKFDLKLLMKEILQSNAYQRTSQPMSGNANEKRFYSRYYPKRMMAEVLHDAIVQVTQVPTKFEFIAYPGADRQKTDFYPIGTRAVQLYDSAVENYFLSSFGRNPRNIVCECERSNEPSTVQVLHISNGKTINEKLRNEKSRASQLTQLRKQGMSDATLIDQIYLCSLARFPTSKEREQLLKMLPDIGTGDEQAVIEDIFWAVMSTKEFLFNH